MDNEQLNINYIQNGGNYAFQTLCLRKASFLVVSFLFHHCFFVVFTLFLVDSSQWHDKKETVWKQALFPHMWLYLKRVEVYKAQKSIKIY